jgi:hypothetical protein
MYQLLKRLDPPHRETFWDRHRNLTRDRTPHAEGIPDEYVCTVQCSQDELVDALRAAGYQRNIFSTYKYVIPRDGSAAQPAWQQGSYALFPQRLAPWMHHCYWFTASEAGASFHLHHHKERNYWEDIFAGRFLTGEMKHWSGERHHGDPDGKLRSALDAADVEYVEMVAPGYSPGRGWDTPQSYLDRGV